MSSPPRPTCAAYALDWPLVEDVNEALGDGALDPGLRACATAQGTSSASSSLALAASLIGDTLLLSPSLFLPGLVAFLTAHGFYIAAFSRGVGFLPSRAALAAIAAFAALVLAYVWPGVAPELKAPVAVYVAVIALMAAQAAGRATVLRDRRRGRGRDRARSSSCCPT